MDRLSNQNLLSIMVNWSSGPGTILFVLPNDERYTIILKEVMKRYSDVSVLSMVQPNTDIKAPSKLFASIESTWWIATLVYGGSRAIVVKENNLFYSEHLIALGCYIIHYGNISTFQSHQRIHSINTNLKNRINTTQRKPKNVILSHIDMLIDRPCLRPLLATNIRYDVLGERSVMICSKPRTIDEILEALRDLRFADEEDVGTLYVTKVLGPKNGLFGYQVGYAQNDTTGYTKMFEVKSVKYVEIGFSPKMEIDQTETVYMKTDFLRDNSLGLKTTYFESKKPRSVQEALMAANPSFKELMRTMEIIVLYITETVDLENTVRIWRNAVTSTECLIFTERSALDYAKIEGKSMCDVLLWDKAVGGKGNTITNWYHGFSLFRQNEIASTNLYKDDAPDYVPKSMGERPFIYLSRERDENLLFQSSYLGKGFGNMLLKYDGDVKGYLEERRPLSIVKPSGHMIGLIVRSAYLSFDFAAYLLKQYFNSFEKNRQKMMDHDMTLMKMGSFPELHRDSLTPRLYHTKKEFSLGVEVAFNILSKLGLKCPYSQSQIQKILDRFDE
jgi:hypothetical protein